MCNAALLSRPLSPLKHALAAVLTHLGGLLPPQLGYSPHRKAIQHDWLWAVGAHPLSWTASGVTYSQLSIDALHRRWVLSQGRGVCAGGPVVCVKADSLCQRGGASSVRMSPLLPPSPCLAGSYPLGSSSVQALMAFTHYPHISGYNPSLRALYNP